MLTVFDKDKTLGTLKYGKPYSFSYLIKNDGGENITITGIAEGCKACTKANIARNILKPGEETTLDVTYTPGSTGISLKGISILYSIGNTQQPEIKLTFKSIVE